MLACALLAGCAGSAPQPDARATDAAVRALLARQVDAWNRGDLEGFMAGYWRSPEMRFASGGSVRQGWQAALDAYRAGYPDRAAMGTLTFSDLDVQPLGSDRALAFGRWTLGGLPGEPPSGLFTLVLQRMPQGWRIVHDHTSSS